MNQSKACIEKYPTTTFRGKLMNGINLKAKRQKEATWPSG